MAFYKEEDILNVTQGGLRVICDYFPEADKCIDNPKKQFRMFRSDEKGASGSLTKSKKKNKWYCTDFGDDSKAYDCFSLVQRMEGCDFPAAVQYIGKKYGVPTSDGEIKPTAKAKFSKKKAPEELPEGHYKFDFLPEIPESHLKVLFSENVYLKSHEGNRIHIRSWDDLRKVCAKYFLFAISAYERVKDGQLTREEANEDYPMFVFYHEKEGWAKIYKPKNPDKAFRFMYFGEKPRDVLNGLSQCIRAEVELNEEVNAERKKGAENEDDENANAESAKRKKLDKVILCSGESDSMNVAALGYHVIFPNSESQIIKSNQIIKLRSIAEEIYILYDIDATGKEQAHKLNMEYLDLRTIELPSDLLERKDFRGNPGKDVRDYLKHYNEYDFKVLLKQSDPYEFWKWTYNKKSQKAEYEVCNSSLYKFLRKNGFCRLDTTVTKDEYIYVHINGCVVKKITANYVKLFVNKFLHDRGSDVELRNTFLRTTQLSLSSLENLELIKLTFNDCKSDSQLIYFKNKVWKVSKDDIIVYNIKNIKSYIWEEDIIPHNVSVIEPTFKVRKEDDKFRIDILNNEDLFLQFLWKLSRVYWKVEEGGIPIYDAQGKKTDQRRTVLTDQEIQEQEQHLVNKLYALGYLLHRYKDPTKAWAVWAMDYKISSNTESHGGSGKSIMFNVPTLFMPHFEVDGRAENVNKDPHLLGGVTKDTGYILFDDCAPDLDFGLHYKKITGGMDVNPKHSQKFTIPFKSSGKMAFTSNFGIHNVSPSTERRVLYTVNSDYYHKGGNKEYKETRSPATDFGKQLLDYGFDEKDFNLFFNTMARAIQLYLTYDDKIDPPMGNVEKRNLKLKMTDGFHDWADVHFDPMNNMFDKYHERNKLLEEYRIATGQKLMSGRKFNDWMKTWCSFYGYDFNPSELQNSQGRIIKQGENGKSCEMIYISSTPGIKKAEEEDLPF